jgi:Spy/CpxP family protein refolding chaperone
MRNLRSLKWAFPICGLALTLGFSLTAIAQNAAPTPQPEATPPAQSAPAPEAQQAPDAQQQDHAQAPAQSQGTSVDDELQLTADQKEKIAAVVDDENKQIAAVRDDTSLTLEQKQQKAQQIRQAGVPKIKAVLTPEQLQKLAAIQERKRQQEQNNPQNSPQTPPQH